VDLSVTATNLAGVTHRVVELAETLAWLPPEEGD